MILNTKYLSHSIGGLDRIGELWAYLLYTKTLLGELEI